MNQSYDWMRNFMSNNYYSYLIILGGKSTHLIKFIHARPWINGYGYLKFLHMGINGLHNNTRSINGYYWITHQTQLTHLELFFPKSPLFPRPFFFQIFHFVMMLTTFVSLLLLFVGFILSFYFLLIC